MSRRACCTDESNHGRFPEYYVSVYTNIPSDLKEIIDDEKKLHKPRRENRGKTIPDLVKGRDFRYTIIPEEYRRWFKERYGQKRYKQKLKRVKLIVLCEHIKFGLKNFSDLDLALIDGDLNSTEVEILEKMLHPIKMPELRHGKALDKTYRGVNLADQAAHKFHDDNSRFKKNGLYLDKLITPRLEEYTPYLI